MFRSRDIRLNGTIAIRHFGDSCLAPVTSDIFYEELPIFLTHDYCPVELSYILASLKSLFPIISLIPAFLKRVFQPLNSEQMIGARWSKRLNY